MFKKARLRKKRKQTRHLLIQIYSWYRKKGASLPLEELETLEANMEAVSSGLLKKKLPPLEKELEQLKMFAKTHFHKSPLKNLKELVGAILFALIVATIIRQSWFELYEIPTGSMRPSFQEKDRLIVSKVDYGINVPLTPKHLYFDDSLLPRGSVITFTAEGMPIHDPDQLYFYLFPGKKRLIKRLIGKPGDILYFYGGKIYGFDGKGSSIETFVNPKGIPNLPHIPIINFMGRVEAGTPSSDKIHQAVEFKQVNQALGRVQVTRRGHVNGEVFYDGEWIKDAGPQATEDEMSYGKLWGINNYAMCRLLTKKELLDLYGAKTLRERGSAPYYLELRHTPSLYSPFLERSITMSQGHVPLMNTLTSFMPLEEKLVEKLYHSIYTSRFVVKEEKAKRYAIFSSYFDKEQIPTLEGVPDGTYEFEAGKAYQINFEGLREALPNSHPLMQYSPEKALTLFNMGIEFLNAYAPGQHAYLFPNRFAYFLEGSFYLMGAKFLEQDDQTLMQFVEQEKLQENKASKSSPYKAFVDEGPPLREDGSLDKEKITKFGLHVPENAYFALGDNYASSADCRDFGFIPEKNMRGSASFVLWPSGERWGFPIQPAFKLLCTPRLIIWGIVVILLITFWVRHKQNLKKPIYRKLGHGRKGT